MRVLLSRSSQRSGLKHDQNHFEVLKYPITSLYKESGALYAFTLFTEQSSVRDCKRVYSAGSELGL